MLPITELWLQRNQIASLETLEALYTTAPHLTRLRIQMNPLSKSMPGYRMSAVAILPHLQDLNGAAIHESERKDAALCHINALVIESTQQTMTLEDYCNKYPSLARLAKTDHLRDTMVAKLQNQTSSITQKLISSSVIGMNTIGGWNTNSIQRSCSRMKTKRTPKCYQLRLK